LWRRLIDSFHRSASLSDWADGAKLILRGLAIRGGGDGAHIACAFLWVAIYAH
jgi:hypothetical protein